MKHTVTKSGDAELRLVWGEVYAPNRPDVHGEFMDAESIRTMAHDFMRRLKQDQIDVQHDKQPVPGIVVVESFIAREGDPDFIPGAWVVCCHVNDAAIWEQVKSGELNGFSVEALVYKQEQMVEIEIPPVITGQTSEVEGHTHEFAVEFDDQGVFKGGTTSEVDGHFHTIQAGTITEEAEGHRHRFSSVDDIVLVEVEEAA